MKLIKALITITMLGCSNINKGANRKVIIMDFLQTLTNEKKVSPNMLHSKYFYQPKFKNNSTSIAYHLLTITSIKESLNTKKTIEILGYKEALDKGKEVYKFDANVDNIYVIIINDNKEEERHIYCLINKDKIESLSVLRKGNIVIGWN